MKARTIRICATVALILLLTIAAAALAGCSSSEDATEPQATEQAAPTQTDADSSGDQHTVPAGDAAQQAVDELNDKIEQSTAGPED